MGKTQIPNFSSTMLLPCDFCSSKPAVLYCRADSAKLCLLCDHRVHSANPLSAKHMRSPVCEHCGSQPVCVRLLPENLMLCSDCDHICISSSSSSADHHHHHHHQGSRKSFIEEFNGCPSSIELARVFGLDALSIFDQELGDLHDFANVPEENSINGYGTFWSFDREKKDVFDQLTEMMNKVEEEEEEEEEEAAVENWKQGDDDLLDQKTSFSSLLMMSGGDQEWRDSCEGELMWNSNNPTHEATQIWDFELGRSRDYEEHSPLETKSAANHAGTLVIKNLGDENSKTRKASFDENNSQLDQPLPDDRKSIEENQNVPVFGSTAESKHVLVMEQPLLPRGENISGSKLMIDPEIHAQNRGFAMLRYMEKKKNRRFDKRIRYESRKARADTRKRVKGRFVKASECPDVKV